ncbi:MAG: PTS glucose transporter subunit IIA, partial [Actinophytocola sp.]|nr:PTS glucose transporter subunit IIA [Actinophytocola sp.]
TVVKLHPHAYVVASADGAAVLVHLGIDTVQLGGEGFTLHVRDGEAVTTGQPLVSFDASVIEAGGRSPVCPVIALDATADQLDEVRDSGYIGGNEALFTLAR